MEPIIWFSIVIGCMAFTMMLLALQSVVLQRMSDLDAFEKRVAQMFDANDVRSGFREAFTTKKIAIKIGDSFHEEKVSDSRPAHALDTSDKKETRASKLANVKSFAINYAPNVGISNKPSIKTLCKQDVIFVNKNAVVQRLIQDCQSFHQLKESKDEETKRVSVFERPLFVCAIEIYDIVNGVSDVNRILDDGFDGILLRNMQFCFDKAGGGAKKMTKIIGKLSLSSSLPPSNTHTHTHTHSQDEYLPRSTSNRNSCFSKSMVTTQCPVFPRKFWNISVVYSL